MLLRREYLQ
ncbi:hypothetical protein V3C99_005681, partial [Haemonchus contortus]